LTLRDAIDTGWFYLQIFGGLFGALGLPLLWANRPKPERE